MKNYLKTLIALMLALVFVFAFVSCGGGGDDDTTPPAGDSTGDNTIPGEDTYDNADDYRIRFVYSYTAKVVNSNGRTEYKKEIKTVDSIYVATDNTGLTEEQKAQYAALSYNGYKFAKWYTEWNTDTQVGVEGKEFALPDGPITADITVYGERGNLAGDAATWSVAPIDEEGNIVADATAEAIDAATELAVTITGTGAMFDFANANEIDVPWYKYVSKVTKVVISDGISVIGTNAFNGFVKLKSIDFGTTVTHINTAAFNGCTSTNFRTLKTPASLVVIGANAFSNTKIKEVLLNDGLTTIAENAFNGSNGIRSIRVPTSLTTVGNAAFHPGSEGGNNKTHSLSKVYYSGTPDQFAAITIAMDNSWFKDQPTIYYYEENAEIGQNTESEIAYWHWADVGGVKTDIPIQYCYTVNYFLESGIVTPIASFRIPVEEKSTYDEQGNVVNAVDENGVIVLEGIVNEALIKKQKAISYDGYYFDWEPDATGKANGLKLGDKITDDKEVTCKRGYILSNYGGVVWSLETLADDGSGTEKYGIVIDIDPTAEDRVYADVANMLAAGEIQLAEVDTILKEKLASIYRIWDFSSTMSTSLMWPKAIRNITKLTINDGVEYLGNNMFAGLSAITEVTLPDSVTEISSSAFEGCTQLLSIYYDSSNLSNCKGLVPVTAADGSVSGGLTGVSATVYAKSYAPTAAAGSYWTTVDGKKLAWVLDLPAADENGKVNGKLTVGGDADMVDFADPSYAPWAEAKDSITSVSFASNITSLGENVINGYYNVNSISLPAALRIIPQNALLGTALVNNTTLYPNGVLVIDNHLIKVDTARRNTQLYETTTGIITIADGAFAGCNAIERVYIAQTLQYINNGAFDDCNLEYIFVEGNESSWQAVSNDITLSGAVSIYYKSDSKPADPDGNYFFKTGNDYAIWGCNCVYGKWVRTTDPTCVTPGVDTRYCIYDERHTDTREVPVISTHVWSDVVSIIQEGNCAHPELKAHKCTVPNCGKYDEPVETENSQLPHYYGVYGEIEWEYVFNADGTATATAYCLRDCCQPDKDGNRPDGAVLVQTLQWVTVTAATADAPETGYFVCTEKIDILNTDNSVEAKDCIHTTALDISKIGSVEKPINKPEATPTE